MTHDRILGLMDPVVKSTGLILRTHCRDINEKNWFLYDWPCRPRSKPSASLDSTFDLPEHDSSCGKKCIKIFVVKDDLYTYKYLKKMLTN